MSKPSKATIVDRGVGSPMMSNIICDMCSTLIVSGGFVRWEIVKYQLVSALLGRFLEEALYEYSE